VSVAVCRCSSFSSVTETSDIEPDVGDCTSIWSAGEAEELLVSPGNATHLSSYDSLLDISESDVDDNSTPSPLSFTDDTLSNVSSNLDDNTKFVRS